MINQSLDKRTSFNSNERNINTMGEMKRYMLIVDDDEDYINDTTTLLKLGGYDDVLAETNPIRALDLVKKHNIVFIVSDFRMPAINGIVLFENIQDLGLKRKIFKVICTGYSEMEDEMDAMKKKGIINDFIFKSPNTDMFMMFIRQCWEKINIGR